MTKELQKLVEKSNLASQAAAKRVLEKFDPEREAERLLTRQLESTLLQLLGFKRECSYDDRSKWVVDHANGRNADSVAGMFAKEEAKEAAKEFLGKLLDGLPEITPKIQQGINKAYRDAYQSKLLSLVVARAEENAKNFFLDNFKDNGLDFDVSSEGHAPIDKAKNKIRDLVKNGNHDMNKLNKAIELLK